jgi:hypothetical protein
MTISKSRFFFKLKKIPGSNNWTRSCGGSTTSLNMVANLKIFHSRARTLQ